MLILRLCRVGQPLGGQFHPVSAAQRDQVVVEVVAGIVQHARACAMAHFAVGAVPIGNEAISARFGLQHEGKVLCAHGGLLRDNVAGAHDAFHDFACKVGFDCAVDGRGVVAIEIKLSAGIKSGAKLVCDLAHARFDQVEHFNGEGTHRALNFAEVGHHIGGFARMHHGHGNDTGINRFFVARDDGLKGLDQLAGHGHRINAVVWQRSMAAFAVNGDFKFIARSHDGAGADRKRAHRSAGPVVHAKDGLHGKFFKHAVFDHLAGAAAAFFGGLEDQINRAIKVAVFGEMFGRCQEHGGVTVVSASVHLALVFAGVGKGVELLHGQSVNVGAQTNAAAASAAVSACQNADDASGAHAAVDGDAPIGELLGDHVGGAFFLEAQLGVRVNVFANGRNAGHVCEDGVDDFHAYSLARLVPTRYNPFARRGH